MSPTHEVVVSHRPADFLAAAGDFLRRSPVQHSVLLTRSAQALDEPADVQAQQLWAWAQSLQGEVVAAAMRTPPHPLGLSLAEPAGLVALADGLAERRVLLDALAGPVESVAAFARRWRELTGANWCVRQRQGIYRADEIKPPSAVPGRVRLASPDDAALLREWADCFERDIGAVVSGVDPVGRRVEQGLLHVWDRGGAPVSMAAATVAMGGVSRVQLVYTPPGERGHGYASAIVAHVSRQVLGRGDVPMLHTDLANSVSNAIYRRIGYTRVGEQRVLTLLPPTAPGRPPYG